MGLWGPGMLVIRFGMIGSGCRKDPARLSHSHSVYFSYSV
jgi:hypothetical protein